MPRSRRPTGPVVDWVPSGATPEGRRHVGQWITVEPVDVERHGVQLWRSFHDSDRDGDIWTYMGYGPFGSFSDFSAWLATCEASRDPLFHALVMHDSGEACGMAALMRFDPVHGVAEVGHIWMAAKLQRTRAATEAVYVLMQHVFDQLGYRRFEWKCDVLNAASRRAAIRFGFTFEGIFRQHLVVKGRNRDTAWYSIIDGEWPQIRSRFTRWLDAANFDANGRQKSQLNP